MRSSKPARLGAMFKKRSAEMNVEYMEGRGAQPEICPQATSGFTLTGGNVVVVMDADRKPREYDVAVPASAKSASFAERKIETEFLSDKSRLIRFPIVALDV